MANNRENRVVFEINNLKTFCKVKMDSAEIGRIAFTFVNFDNSRAQGNKVVAESTIYLDFATAKLLAQDILSGRIAVLCQKEQARAQGAGEKYCNAIWKQMGGVNEKKCKERGIRTDGMALSRVMTITPGSRKPVIFDIKQGAGKSNEQGLIVPQYGNKPEVSIMVALDFDTLKKMAVMINTHIDGFISAQYAAQIIAMNNQPTPVATEYNAPPQVANAPMVPLPPQPYAS